MPQSSKAEQLLIEIEDIATVELLPIVGSRKEKSLKRGRNRRVSLPRARRSFRRSYKTARF